MGKKAKKVAKKPKDKNQPKRPMSALMFFSNDMRPKVQAELGTTDFGPVAKKVSEMWKALTNPRKTLKRKRNTKKTLPNTRRARTSQITKQRLRIGNKKQRSRKKL